jgi:hypothetical protein
MRDLNNIQTLSIKQFILRQDFPNWQRLNAFNEDFQKQLASNIVKRRQTSSNIVKRRKRNKTNRSCNLGR